ncbi:GCG_CRPN prefix-to-repeats domain-containing protein [Mesorhizobium sp. SP-1A]|uniref:GCG_CRPN prefix-to-repeats domain-containing protein n=1 Tax=Mesorhizobium sp. SP-1A TaxID=3077840 RepID=UPI0028F6DEF9|nr:hypothetical protein [Mesorhizobium sp. SP-1A]
MLRKLAMAALMAAGTLGTGMAVSGPANAGPIAAPPIAAPQGQGLPTIDVRDGCGRGWRLNRWGRCVPMRWRPVARYGWYGPRYEYGWHRPYYRHEWRREHWRHYREWD